MDRRRFLRMAGAAALTPTLGRVLAACGGDDDAESSAGTGGGGGRKVNVGFIALTDAASVIMAYELGEYANRGLDVSITKQASWPATRDALLSGQIDAAHCLFSMPFSVATGIGGNSPDLRIAMILNNNGQAITLSKDFAEVGYGDLGKAKALLESKDAPTLAMTFPGGTHDLWLRYWVKAAGVDANTLKIEPVPPPQMVQNMSVGNVQGYCVGEPWNAVAVAQDIGFTHITTQDLWLNHPEKALVVSARFAEERPDDVKALVGSVLAASKWLDVPSNRSKAADTIGVEHYINAKPDDIRGRLTGTYDLGAGLGTKDFAGTQMMFFRDGQTNFPRRSYGHWALTQYQRLGLLSDAPPFAELVDQLILTELYAAAAEAEGVPVPDDDMAPLEVALDGAVFDPAQPQDEVNRV